MNILFVGDTRSPFISDDYDLLRHMQQPDLLMDLNKVTLFDLGIHAKSFDQIPEYLIKSFSEWRTVRDNDVVWIWFADYPALPFVMVAKIFGKKVVVNIGGYEVCAYPEINYGNQLQVIRGFVSRMILKMADKVVVQSKAYEKIVRGLTGIESVIIPPYIDTTLCNIPLPEKNPIAITSSCSHKNDILKGIPVFNKVRMQSIYQSKVLRNVTRPALECELAKAKVYCQLSYTEQFNITTLEAMALGCIPVVSDRDGLPETVGNTGIVVPYGDVAATVEAINKAMHMDGSAARERARQFTFARKAKAVEQLLYEVLK